MLILLLKLLHIATVIALFAGLTGRFVTYEQARRASEGSSVTALLTASGWLD